LDIPLAHGQSWPFVLYPTLAVINENI